MIATRESIENPTQATIEDIAVTVYTARMSGVSLHEIMEAVRAVAQKEVEDAQDDLLQFYTPDTSKAKMNAQLRYAKAKDELKRINRYFED